MLKQNFRLRKKQNFTAIYKKGNMIAGKFVYLRYIRNNIKHPRLTVTVGLSLSKKATERNRLKRLAREVVQQNLEDILLNKNHDIIVTFRKNVLPLEDSEGLKQDLTQCLKRLP